MSNWLSSLKDENRKLKEELKSLKTTFKLALNFKKIKESNNEIQGKINNSLTRQYNLLGKSKLSIDVSNKIKENIDPSHRSSNSCNPEKIIKNLINLSLCPKRINKKGTKTEKKYENKKHKACQSENFLSQIRKNSEIIEPNIPHSNNIPSKERNLLDSLESYYESEEENLEKTGKCKLSYLKHKEKSLKMPRSNSKNISEDLLSNFSTFSNKSNLKNLTNLINIQTSTNKVSDSQSNSSQFIFDKTSNCKRCDSYLHSGKPSTHCRRHSKYN